nr:MAG TPA: hypothetical protein [Caudoviricetes sp.]
MEDYGKTGGYLWLAILKLEKNSYVALTPSKRLNKII